MAGPVGDSLSGEQTVHPLTWLIASVSHLGVPNHADLDKRIVFHHPPRPRTTCVQVPTFIFQVRTWVMISVPDWGEFTGDLYGPTVRDLRTTVLATLRVQDRHGRLYALKQDNRNYVCIHRSRGSFSIGMPLDDDDDLAVGDWHWATLSLISVLLDDLEKDGKDFSESVHLTPAPW